MNQTRLFTAFLCFWVFLFPQSTLAQESPSAPPVIELSLEEVVQIALAQNPSIIRLLAGLEISDERIGVVSAPAKLTIDAQAAIYRVQPAQQPTVEATLSGIEGEFRTNPNFSYTLPEASLNITKLIYDGGQIANRIAAARLTNESSHYSAVGAWRDLYLQLFTTYVSVLRSQEQVGNAVQSLELARENMTTAEKRFAAGQAPRGDIVFAQVPLSQAELELERSTTQQESAREALLLLMGLPQNTPFRVEGLPDQSTLTLSKEEALKHALDQRADLLAVSIEAESASKTAKAVSRGGRPQVALAANVVPVGFDGSSFAPGGYRVGVVMKVPVLNGGLVEHQTNIAKAEHTSKLAEVELKRQEIEREVREAFRAVELAELSKKATALQVDTARESLRIAQGQYNAGLAPFQIVNEQQRELVRAQGAQTQSTYDFIIAKAQLEKAIGMQVWQESIFLPPELDTKGSQNNNL